MTVIKSEFFLALNQVATERGISPDEVVESIKMAVLAAYKKDYGTTEDEEENLEVRIDTNSGDTRIFKDDKDITPAGFGRIAAQTARQVILQKIREAEKKTIIKHYQAQIGTIIRGRVIRFDGRNVSLDIGKAEGFLPYEEQIRRETYQLNDSLIVYIKEIQEDEHRGSRIIVSRADPKLVEELFRKEVPEIASSTVKVKNVVREPGERTKIAVFSDQPGVDPVGACVGQKGIRVKAVTDELGGDEKVDIIQYNDDDAFFVREALSPAKVASVEIDKKNKRARVYVSGEQAPLAIGRGGVNVNLASRLTEYELDIVQTEEEKSKEEKKPVEQSEEAEKTDTPKDSKPEDKKVAKKPKKETVSE